MSKIILTKDSTYPVFSFSDLEHLELLSAGALGHLPLDLVVNPLGVGEGAAVLPVGPQGDHELLPVDHPVAVVKLVGHCVHLELAGAEFIPEDSVNELITGTVTVTVVIKLPEEVLNSRLLVVVVLEVQPNIFLHLLSYVHENLLHLQHLIMLLL